MTGCLDVERNIDAWTLTLNRTTKMNALSAELVEALIDAVEQAHANGARLLIFKGAGKNFSAGFDFGELDSQTDGDLLLRFVRIEILLQMVASSPCLTLAFAHGNNFGAAVDLFAACQQRVCSADASFRMPGLKFGLVLGTRRFGNIVGRAAALDILQASRTMSADNAQHIGLVHRIVQISDWPVVIDEARQTASILSQPAQRQLHQALATDANERDMYDLVCSAAVPGLKARVAAYLG